MTNLGRESLWVGESQAVYIQEEDSAADIFFNGPGEDFGVPMGLRHCRSSVWSYLRGTINIHSGLSLLPVNN